MRPEMRDRVLAAWDEAARQVGGESFEQAIKVACQILEKLLQLVSSMRTREQAIAVLDQMPDFLPEEENLAAASMRMLPQFIASQIHEHLPGAINDLLPADKRGRRKVVSAYEEAAVCRMIGDLFAQDVKLTDAKKRAAQRYGISVRSVERVWGRRAEIASRFPEPDFEAVMQWTKKLLSE